MEVTLVLTRLFLAVIFLIAGVAKLFDLPGSKKALTEFGLPTSWASPLSILLPVAEVVTAIALIPAVSAGWGAWGAVALLLVFITGISVNLARGRKPDCHCFGQLHSQPIGRPTLIRNTILLTAACFLVWQGRATSVPGIFVLGTVFSAIQIMELLIESSLVLMLTAVGWFVLHLSRQNGRLLLRVEALESHLNVPQTAPSAITSQGLPIGVAAPPFQLPDLDGKEVTLEDLRAKGKPLLLVFSDPHCGPCKTLLTRLADWQQQQRHRLTFVVISRGSLEENRAKSMESGDYPVLLQREREVAEAYQINGTPGAVLLLPDGTIGSSAAMGAEAISILLSQLTGTALSLTHSAALLEGTAQAPGNRNVNGLVNIGQPAPSIQLPDLTGNLINLKDFRGQPLLVLFWNPSCGYCQRMLPELQAWEGEHPEDAPKLLLISTGTAEANRTLGLRALVLLDEGFIAGQAFGAGSTPSAILMDTENRIASVLHVGSAEIKKLLMPLQQAHTTLVRL